MIVAIEGVVVYQEPTFLHVKLNSGLTYKVSVSLQSSAKVKENEKVSLKISHIIREDAELLFGFLSIDEQRMFEALLKVNGVGPSTAMAACSTISPNGFSEALIHSNIDAFKKVPGVGPKTAKRILVELSEFALVLGESAQSPIYQEALLALESLGFKKVKINSALKHCTSSSTSELIKEALQKLS